MVRNLYQFLLSLFLWFLFLPLSDFLPLLIKFVVCLFIFVVSILEQLQLGIARFELSSSPVSSISPSNSVASSFPLSMNPSYPLFAKIGPVL